MRIIAFTGSMGSGKTTAAEYLQTRLRSVVILKFAKPLYDIQSFINTKLGYNRLAKHKFRPVMQFIGKWARDLDPDCWIHLWRDDYEAYALTGIYGTVVVDDLRYENEAALLKELGATIIKINSDESAVKQRIETVGETHESERGIPDRYIDYYINNNSSMLRFKKQLENIIKLLELK